MSRTRGQALRFMAAPAGRSPGKPVVRCRSLAYDGQTHQEDTMHAYLRHLFGTATRKFTRRDAFRAGITSALFGTAKHTEAKALYQDSVYTRLLGVKPLLS